MPARRMMQTEDVREYLGISKMQSYYLMNRLEMAGLTIDLYGTKTTGHGKAKLIDGKVFAKWLSDQDGVDVNERIHDVQSFLVQKSIEKSKESVDKDAKQ